MKFKKLIIPLIFLFGILLAGCAPDAMDSNGRPINISNYQGKWVVIHYWASWCAPCIQEIPDMIKLATYYKPKVVVLGVNTDNLSNSALNDLAQGYGVNYPFLSKFPIGKWTSKSEELPVIYILDPKGRLYKILKGPQTLQSLQTVMGLPDISYD